MMMTQSSVKYQDKIIGQNAKCKGGRYRIESGIFSAARKWVGVLRVYSSAAGQLLVNTLFLPNTQPAKPCTAKGVWAELGRIV